MTRKGLFFVLLITAFTLFTGALVFAMSGTNQDGSVFSHPGSSITVKAGSH